MGFAEWKMAIIAAATLIAPIALAESHSDVVQIGDVEKGAKVFKKCKACHQVGENAKNRTGPVLNGLIGRGAGTAEGFKYSKSMIAAGEAGLIWDEAIIAVYLESPKAFLQDYLDDTAAKSKMILKVKKEKDRVNVAAYVGTFSVVSLPEDPVTE